MTVQTPKVDIARPIMPLKCSGKVALMLADDLGIGYSESERLAYGQAKWTKVREQIAREFLVYGAKRTMKETNDEGTRPPVRQPETGRERSVERTHPARDAKASAFHLGDAIRLWIKRCWRDWVQEPAGIPFG